MSIHADDGEHCKALALANLILEEGKQVLVEQRNGAFVEQVMQQKARILRALDQADTANLVFIGVRKLFGAGRAERRRSEMVDRGIEETMMRIGMGVGGPKELADLEALATLCGDATTPRLRKQLAHILYLRTLLAFEFSADAEATIAAALRLERRFGTEPETELLPPILAALDMQTRALLWLLRKQLSEGRPADRRLLYKCEDKLTILRRSAWDTWYPGIVAFRQAHLNCLTGDEALSRDQVAACIEEVGTEKCQKLLAEFRVSFGALNGDGFGVEENSFAATDSRFEELVHEVLATSCYTEAKVKTITIPRRYKTFAEVFAQTKK
jgi:hypothetical protein